MTTEDNGNTRKRTEKNGNNGNKRKRTEDNGRQRKNTEKNGRQRKQRKQRKYTEKMPDAELKAAAEGANGKGGNYFQTTNYTNSTNFPQALEW